MISPIVATNSRAMERLLAVSPILPVVTVKNVEDGLAVARALFQGGIHIIEITLRTECAFDAIVAIIKSMPEIYVGGGTVTSSMQLKQLRSIHASFAVSPGLTLDLLKQAKALDIPYLPGITSVSELMVGLSEGYECFKFFPAVASGGIKTLNSLAGPFSEVKFCPTGGINEENFEQYLALPNIIGVGGSWIASEKLIEAKNWEQIEKLSRRAIELVAKKQSVSSSSTT